MPRDREDKFKRKKMKKNDKKEFLFRKKSCKFCLDKIDTMDYKDAMKLRKFISEKGKILPRYITGNCAKHQRIVASAVKRARYIALLPYVGE